MVQAATAGLVDFGKAKYFDPKWHQYLRLILSGLARCNRRELRQLLFTQAVAVYTSRQLKAEQIEEIGQKVSDLYHDIRETYYPQDKDLRVQHEKQLVRKDVSDWQARFGDLSDKKVKEKIDEFAAAMDRLRVETAAKMRESAASQLGYMGRELGINPEARGKQKPRKVK